MFCDSADDGVEGELYDTSDTSADELAAESERIADRLAFLSRIGSTVENRCRRPALCAAPRRTADEELGPFDCMATMRHWVHDSIQNHRQLIDLLETVRDYRLQTFGTDPDALQQYDRLRLIKDSLLERIATTCVDISTTGQLMLASLAAQSDEYDEEITASGPGFRGRGSSDGAGAGSRHAR